MKVPALIDKETIEFQERPKPQLQPGEVLLKVAFCGICGSDMRHYLQHLTATRGEVMGHEFSAVVAERGDGVHTFKPGDRVGVRPLAPCGRCYWCQRGYISLCPVATEQLPGISPGYDGGFAPYVKILHPDDMLYPLPPTVSLKDAALLEPLAVSLHALRLAKFELGDRVMVIGAGMLGLGLIQFLKMGGPGKIVVLEPSPRKSQIARELGADLVLNPLEVDEDEVRARVGELTDGIGADSAFDCAGVPASFRDSINYLKRGGQAMILGAPPEGTMNSGLLLHGELEMKGVFGYYHEYDEVIRLLEQEKIDTEALISDVISPDEVDEKGFKRILAAPYDYVRILVEHGE